MLIDLQWPPFNALLVMMGDDGQNKMPDDTYLIKHSMFSDYPIFGTAVYGE